MLQNEPNSPRPSLGEEISFEDNEYDVYDDNSMIHDINLEDLADFGEIDKQFFAINKSRSNSVAKPTQAPVIAGNVRTTRHKGESTSQTQQEGAKEPNNGQVEVAKEGQTNPQKEESAQEKLLQEKVNQKIQEKLLEKVGEVEERNRSNSVTAPESMPKSDNVPPVVTRHDRSNSISEGGIYPIYPR